MQQRLIFLFIYITLAFMAGSATAQDRALEFTGERAVIFSGTPAQPLTTLSNQPPLAVVSQFLKTRGINAHTIDSLHLTTEARNAPSGLDYLRLQQKVADLRVHDAYVKATLSKNGELIHLIHNLAEVTTQKPTPARVNEQNALHAALQHLYPSINLRPTLISHKGNLSTFSKDAFFYSAPSVEKVAVAMTNGTLKVGFLVETWTQKDNLLNETLISGEGQLMRNRLRTNNDSYNVFSVDPEASPQTIITGPGAGNTQSPAGWLSGIQYAVNITGNNVHAYLDTDANNRPDTGGAKITDGNFLTIADLSSPPSATVNKNVAVQNLFYLNNVLHDTLYQHGFVEGVGNFQKNNFNQGGRDNDPVKAEAQDGSGTDNASFATPVDGRNPRMQMYLWSGPYTHEIVIGNAVYLAQGAAFGGTVDTTGLTAIIELVNDATNTTMDACETITNNLAGKIALIDRGNCNYTVKIQNAENAGAIAAIVANNVSDGIAGMGSTDDSGDTITIPAVSISQSDGNTIKLSLPTNGTVRLANPAPLMRDGDLDSDVVYHEYGHGLTWRMIGSMDGPLAGAIGEGMSDALAVILNENDLIGEYSYYEPLLGLRSAPYHNYPRTYIDVAGKVGDADMEVHYDGEVYGAIGWRLFELFSDQGISKNSLLDYIVDGMNYTPAAPSFEQMRDGILQSVTNSGSGHECLIWQAFAQYGVGVGAKGRVTRTGDVVVTESFTLPTQCQ